MGKEKSLKVVISGYYGFGNTGDEAILTSLLNMLRQDNSLEITVLSAHPRQTRMEHKVKAVSRFNPFSIMVSILRSNLLISGGGGLLQDVTSSRSLLYYLSVISLGLLSRKKVILLAQSIGPIKRKINRYLTSFVLSRTSLITVRDHHSRIELEHLQVKGAPIKVTADLAFLLEPLPNSQQNSLKNNLGLREPYVIFALRRLKHKEIPLEKFALLATKLSQAGFQTVFLPFQASFDQEICQYLEKRVPKSLALGELKPREILSVFAGARLVFAMRLHALILACKAAAPFIPFSYDPKIDAFSELLGIEPFDLDFSEEKIWGKVEKILANSAKISEDLKEKAGELEKKARENWSAIQEILDNELR